MVEEQHAPTPQRRSRLRRVFETLLVVVLPLAIFAATLWLSSSVVSTVTTRIGQQMEYRSRAAEFEAAATAAAPAEGETRSGFMLMRHEREIQQEPTATPDALTFVTNTPRPEIEITIPAESTAVPAQQAQVTATIPAVEPLVLPTIFFPEDAPQNLIDAAPTAIPARLEPLERSYDLVNIVLLGSDEEITNDNTIRTDTMIIVSINRDTGTVNMMSLPRDLFVYVPGLGMSRLNVAYGWGEQVGWTGGGFGLFRDTIIYNLGINIHYYAKVNITEFEQIVDLVGGVDIAVDCAYQDWYPVAPIEDLDLTRPLEENYYLRTLDVGYYTLDGFDAQWFARSRKNSTDFDRGRRQQQLIRAIFRKALANGQVSQLPALWSEGMEIVETNMSREEAISLLPLAINLDTSKIEQFTLAPTYHTESWTTPDGESNVQLPIYETLLPLLQDFYAPPTANQIEVRGATIRVFNGTGKPDIDRVAAEALQNAGFSAYAAGTADGTTQEETTLMDYIGQTKGSSTPEIASILNLSGEAITQQPDPNRVADYDVVVGTSYNSCPGGVLPIQEVAANEGTSEAN
jgi:polyisoprenyl-teichoic acid--peptidoglycan teichoic acid transferase